MNTQLAEDRWRVSNGSEIGAIRLLQKGSFDRGAERRLGPTVGGTLEEHGALRVLVVGGTWWWREAVLRVLERAGGFNVTEADLGDAKAGDVAIVDLEDPVATAKLGLLREREISCLAVSDRQTRSEIVTALNASASYAVRSELDPERLAQLVRVIASGEALFVRAGRGALAGLGGRIEDAATRYGLTPRELDVLRLLAEGRTNAEIAGELHLASSSVKKLVSRALVRLGVRNRVEAAVVARREGIVPPDDDIRLTG